MTRRIRLLWKLLLAFFATCAFASLAAWAILLSTICSNPRTPIPKTQHVIAYSCHGMTVFISPFQDAMLHWLIPIEGLFIFLSLIAATAVVFSFANVQIDVQIHHTGASSKSPNREDESD